MTKMTTKPKAIPTISAGSYRRTLKRRIAKYEQRYEMSTAAMRELILRDGSRETNEVAKWIHDANVLEFLASPANGTAGSDSTASNKSIKGR